MSTVRAFVAIHLNDETRAALARAQAKLKETGAAVRWVNPAAFHLTLKFLGDIEVDRAPDAAQIIAECIKGVQPFRIGVRGLGGLPRIERPRVICVGVVDERNVLEPVANALNNRMCSLGVEREDRRFKAHLTLGRVKSPKRIEPLIEMIRAGADTEYGAVDVGSIYLMKSELKPAGAEYAVLHEARL